MMAEFLFAGVGECSCISCIKYFGSRGSCVTSDKCLHVISLESVLAESEDKFEKSGGLEFEQSELT